MSLKALPSKEHTFTISVKGSETGETFEGTFMYRKPNILAKSNISKTEAMLNGGVGTLDDDTRFIHQVLAALKHTLVQYPDWWKENDFGLGLFDLNVVIDIYAECNKFEQEWNAKVWEGKDPEPKK